MGRAATNVKGKTVEFSTRHLRMAHRDRLRIYASMLGLNVEEVLDLALERGLPLVAREALRLEKARREG